MNRAASPSGDAQGGFSLIELIFVMAIMSILLSLGALAARQFWFQRALIAGQDEIASQLRAVQQQVIAEGVSGRYHGAWFDPGASDWGTVRYQSSTCTSTGNYDLAAGVEVESVTVATTVAEVNFASPTDIAATCRTQLSLASDTRFVWFLSRGMGTETSGDHIEIIQPRRDDRTEQIRVYGLTGRVEKVG